jgi:GNAT superfamily N-acetyltransferase
MRTPKQIDAEIAEILGLSPYAQYLRDAQADFLRERRYQKLATGSARGEPYEIYGDETGSYTVLRSKDLSELATAYVADDGRKNYLTSVLIKDPKYQRLGIGTALYNAIEKHRGRKLEPSPLHQTPEAKAFWSRRTSRAK